MIIKHILIKTDRGWDFAGADLSTGKATITGAMAAAARMHAIENLI